MARLPIYHFPKFFTANQSSGKEMFDVPETNRESENQCKLNFP